ncbi:cyclic nucleotide-binding domain-containing protein [Flindersiella endophytica]
MTGTVAIELAAHPFLQGLRPRSISAIAAFSSHVTLRAGERVFDVDGDADRFWLLLSGRVNLDLHSPGRGDLLVETIGAGDILGWSWLFPPYRWQFGAVAVEDTRAIVVEAKSLRVLCTLDNMLGMAMYERFAKVALHRLQATRMRLLDIYAATGSGT